MKYSKWLIVLILIIFPSLVSAKTIESAKEKINLEQLCNVKLEYKCGDKNLGDLKIKIYRMASFTSDYKYKLINPFDKYDLFVNGIQGQDEWNEICDTANAYISADGIQPSGIYTTSNNILNIDGLYPGLYLIKTDYTPSDDYRLYIDDFIVSLPLLNDDDLWDYDAKINPKCEIKEIDKEKILKTAIVEWDDLNSKDRPTKVVLKIFKDSILVDSVVLSNDNNWTYKWYVDNDGSEWTVMEEGLPSDYKMVLDVKTNKYIIINKARPSKDITNPKTGDDIYLYLVLFGCSFLGIVLMIIYILKSKRKRK